MYTSTSIGTDFNYCFLEAASSNNISGDSDGYGFPESTALSLESATGAFISKINKGKHAAELSRRLDQLLPFSFDVNTGNKVWANPKYLKYSKWAGYAGTGGDVANISGILYNVYILDQGWTTRNVADGVFGAIGCVPVYGDIIALPYTLGTSWMDYSDKMIKKDVDMYIKQCQWMHTR